MEYSGYRNREEIFSYVEECFPFVERPDDQDLIIVDDENYVSRYILEHMSQYTEPRLPIDGVRYLHDELISLSAEGMRWLLPSLLRKAVLSDRYDSLSEFFVHDLEADIEESCLKERYSLLNLNQIKCLIAVLEYFGEEFGHSIALAQENVKKFIA
jgi:hypothetical protein